LVKLLRIKSELAQEAAGKALAILYDIAYHYHYDTSATITDSSSSSTTTTSSGPGELSSLGLTNDLVRLLRGPTAPLVAIPGINPGISSSTPPPPRVSLEVDGLPPDVVPMDIGGLGNGGGGGGSSSSSGESAGGGPNPFKEICALSCDLGRPQLLYYFLSLPSRHNIWSTRPASPFTTTTASTTSGGGAVIISHRLKLKESLRDQPLLLVQLLPRLLRAKYDPSTSFRQVNGTSHCSGSN